MAYVRRLRQGAFAGLSAGMHHSLNLTVASVSL